MNTFHAVAISTEVANSVRATMKSPRYGFPAHREVAEGRSPCRHCLQLITPKQDELILFTMDAFQGMDVPPSPGPVYIHAENCRQYRESEGIPEVYRGRLLTLEAFGENRILFAEARTQNGNDQALAEKLFTDPRVEYVNVRSTEAGCFLFRLERN